MNSFLKSDCVLISETLELLVFGAIQLFFLNLTPSYTYACVIPKLIAQEVQMHTKCQEGLDSKLAINNFEILKMNNR